MVTTMDAVAARRDQRQRGIRRAAMGLFLEHGFDAVTTSEVAKAAGVSPATLFNHFRTKEDLFFGQVEELERTLIERIGGCGEGQSILDVMRGHVVYELTAGRAHTDPTAIAPFHRQVMASAALQAREAEIYRSREAALAAALVQALDVSEDPLPALVAAGLYIAAEKIIATRLRVLLTQMKPTRALSEIDGYIDDVFDALSVGLGTLPAHPSVAGGRSRVRASTTDRGGGA